MPCRASSPGAFRRCCWFAQSCNRSSRVRRRSGLLHRGKCSAPAPERSPVFTGSAGCRRPAARGPALEMSPIFTGRAPDADARPPPGRHRSRAAAHCHCGHGAGDLAGFTGSAGCRCPAAAGSPSERLAVQFHGRSPSLCLEVRRLAQEPIRDRRGAGELARAGRRPETLAMVCVGPPRLQAQARQRLRPQIRCRGSQAGASLTEATSKRAKYQLEATRCTSLLRCR